MTNCNQRQIKHRAKFKNVLGVNKWSHDNSVTLVSASNNGKPWEDKDDVFLLSSKDTVLSKAIQLGRTKFSVENRIKFLNKNN
jgi:hypothetical protein